MSLRTTHFLTPLTIPDSGTIFTGQLDQNVWGKGPAAAVKLADNIQRVDDFTLQDKTSVLSP